MSEARLPRPRPTAARPGRAAGWTPLASCLAMLALVGCGRAAAPSASPATDGGAPAIATATPPPPPEVANDDLVARVDFGSIRVADVRARLAGVGDEAVLRALGAAVLDELALRELRVIGHGPKPGESRSQAVDRLLPQVFGGAGCARVDDAAIRLRFMGALGRFRHPRSWTVWEAYLPCCDEVGCDPATRARCLAETAPAARALVGTLRTALAAVDLAAAVSEGAAWPLDASPARRDAVPAFETTIAAAPAVGARRWQLRRYTFFGRGDQRFPESSFRRVDPAFEAAVAALDALGTIAGPVELERGWSVAMLAAHEPLRWSDVTDADVTSELRAEVCAQLVQQERDAWLERLGKTATVQWNQAQIRAVWGAGVVSRLPVWSREERLRAAAPILP